MYKDKPPKVRFPDFFLHLTKYLKLLTASSESYVACVSTSAKISCLLITFKNCFVFSLFPNVLLLYPLRFQNRNRKGRCTKRRIQKENHD